MLSVKEHEKRRQDGEGMQAMNIKYKRLEDTSPRSKVKWTNEMKARTRDRRRKLKRYREHKSRWTGGTIRG